MWEDWNEYSGGYWHQYPVVEEHGDAWSIWFECPRTNRSLTFQRDKSFADIKVKLGEFVVRALTEPPPRYDC